MADEILETIKAADEEFDTLKARQDKDWDLWRLKTHEFVDSNGKKFPNGYAYTTPLPRAMADSVTATLEQAEVNGIVKSNTLSQEQCSTIEQFSKDAWACAEEWSQRFYRKTVDSANHQQLPVRGVIVTRLLVQVEDIDGEKQLVIDAQVWDGRWCKWEDGRDGWLAWGALELKMSKSRALAAFGVNEEIIAAIKAVWGDDKGKKLITDAWTPEVHNIYVDKENVYTEPNQWGFVPLVVTDSGLGTSMIPEDGSMEYDMDSIYHGVRDIIPILNQNMSKEYSRSMEGYRRSLLATGPEGATADAIDNPSPRGGSGDAETDVTVGPDGMKVDNLYPPDDTKTADLSLQTELEQDIQEARVMSPFSGNLDPKNPWSGAALIQIAEDQKKSLVPMIKSLQMYRTQIFYMMRRMFKEGKISGPIGPQGRKSVYSWQNLEGDYSIEFKYLVTLPAETIANYSLGRMAQDLGLPLEWIIDEILGVEEPKKLMALSRLAKMEDMSPRILTGRAAQDAFDQEDQRLLSQILAENVVSTAELESMMVRYDQVINPQQIQQAQEAQGSNWQVQPGKAPVKLSGNAPGQSGTKAPVAQVRQPVQPVAG